MGKKSRSHHGFEDLNNNKSKKTSGATFDKKSVLCRVQGPNCMMKGYGSVEKKKREMRWSLRVESRETNAIRYS